MWSLLWIVALISLMTGNWILSWIPSWVSWAFMGAWSAAMLVTHGTWLLKRPAGSLWIRKFWVVWEFATGALVLIAMLELAFGIGMPTEIKYQISRYTTLTIPAGNVLLFSALAMMLVGWALGGIAGAFERKSQAQGYASDDAM